MKLNKLILAASVAAALSTAGVANAASSALAFDEDGYASIFVSGIKTSFDNIYTFTLAAPYDLGASVNASVKTLTGAPTVVFTSFSLYSDPVVGPDALVGSASNLLSPKIVTTSTLAAGNYYIEVKGYQAISGTSGVYQGGVAVTPVPEPESYAMLLAGLGLMGTIARRRSKSKAV